MERREIAELNKDLGKLAASKAPDAPTSLLRILKDLQKNVKPTEELLRATMIGKTVNRVKAHDNKEVASLAAEIVSKWRHTVNMQKQANGGSSGTATPTNGRNGTLSPMPANKPPTSAPKAASPSVPMDKRNWKVDGIKKNGLTSDPARDNCVGLIYDGLCPGSELPSKQILEVAKEVESAALNLPGAKSSSNSPIYKDKIRSLFQNLKNKSNPKLRERVLSGKIAPARFVTMTHDELKSKEQRKEQEDLEKENMNNAMVAQEEKSISTALQCGKCGQKKVSYSQAQTRSADEPMTTFCECLNCGNRWKFS